MNTDPAASEPPPLIEALAVWGWAVQHGGIPLAYAAAVLADHPCYVHHSGVDDPTPTERVAWASEDLTGWEDVVVRMDWPGDAAIDEERCDQDAYWRLREDLLRHLGHDAPEVPTSDLLARYCDQQIAECNRLLAEQHTDNDRKQD
jgi:hypothetical protein